MFSAAFDECQNLNNCIDRLNSYYKTIQFTYEIKINNSLPFLDILVKHNIRNLTIEYEIRQIEDTFNSMVHRTTTTTTLKS